MLNSSVLESVFLLEYLAFPVHLNEKQQNNPYQVASGITGKKAYATFGINKE